MVAENYDWDEIEDNVDEEYDDAGVTVADYTTEPYLYGDLISQHRSGQSRFYCFDAVGSTLALTDSGGNTTDTYAYTAFGEVSESAGGTVNPFQYVGQKQYLKQVAARFYIIRRRLYSQGLGRWCSTDPRQVSGESPFAYCGNGPLSRWDLNALAYALISYAKAQEPPPQPKQAPKLGPDLPKEDKPPPPPPDKKWWDAHCRCATQEQPPAELDPDTVAFVACQDGKVEFKYNPFYWQLAPPHRADWDLYVECKYDKCIETHEKLHLAQIANLCPDICKGKTCTRTSWVTVAFGPTDPRHKEKCKAANECAAYVAELNCIFKAYQSYLKEDKGHKCVKPGADALLLNYQIITVLKCKELGFLKPLDDIKDFVLYMDFIAGNFDTLKKLPPPKLRH